MRTVNYFSSALFLPQREIFGNYTSIPMSWVQVSAKEEPEPGAEVCGWFVTGTVWDF